MSYTATSGRTVGAQICMRTSTSATLGQHAYLPSMLNITFNYLNTSKRQNFSIVFGLCAAAAAAAAQGGCRLYVDVGSSVRLQKWR